MSYERVIDRVTTETYVADNGVCWYQVMQC